MGIKRRSPFGNRLLQQKMRSAVLEVRLLGNAGVSRSCFYYAGTPPYA